jgi:hypothetical protein
MPREKTAHEVAFQKSARTMAKIVRLAQTLSQDDKDYLCAKIQDSPKPVEPEKEGFPS